MGEVTNENVAGVVRSKKVDDDQLERIENLACAAETMIETILKNVPSCADRSAAIRKVREAKWTATDAIASNGLI